MSCAVILVPRPIAETVIDGIADRFELIQLAH